MKICGRCHELIKPGQDYDTHTPHSGNGAAPTEFLHKGLCERVLRQTAPEERTNRY